MTDQSNYRIGDEERRRAASLLESHFQAGRLDADEYEDRRGKALDAVTQADLDTLFTDLPAQAPQPLSGAGEAVAGEGSPSRSRRQLRDTVMALLPFLALLLFFVTKQWLWFLMIPVGGIVLYGQGGRPSRRDRRPDRDG
ncbi:DUF1707 domain-containing protein [Intrasporangium sp.]|uniref:DUF1707 SHOCT-like domain-containing protein n=1 Tax=Intrasporangium sp. TaxID=1925024 RepID=UPI0032218469